MIKKLWKSLILGFFVLNQSFSQGNLLYQYATFHSLASGNFEGDLTIKELLLNGNSGIGTFNNLDGELILLNGVCYKAKAIDSNGKQLEEVSLQEKTPFAMNVFFEANDSLRLTNCSRAYVDSAVLNSISKNALVAFRITGKFSEIKFRSVAAQPKPFPILSEAVKSQKIFEKKNISGTLIGFYFPSYMDGLNVAGFHWHFIDNERLAGGHVLDYVASEVKILIDVIPAFHLDLPKSKEFLNSGFKATKRDIELIEKAK